MLTAGENRVESIVAVGWDKKVMPPLRELPGAADAAGQPGGSGISFAGQSRASKGAFAVLLGRIDQGI